MRWKRIMVIGGVVGFAMLAWILITAWILPRYGRAVFDAKAPRIALAIVLKKDCSNTEAHAGGTRSCLIWYRLEDFYQLRVEERAAVLKKESARFQREGARVREVSEEQFQKLKIGDEFPISYAYYPNVLGEVSADIRVPW